MSIAPLGQPVDQTVGQHTQLTTQLTKQTFSGQHQLAASGMSMRNLLLPVNSLAAQQVLRGGLSRHGLGVFYELQHQGCGLLHDGKNPLCTGGGGVSGWCTMAQWGCFHQVTQMVHGGTGGLFSSTHTKGGRLPQ